MFTTTDADGARNFDAAGWEAAIQSVLAACKEFNVPCGYPATENDIEMRMQQGFSVFIMGWGEAGFRAIDLGRKASGIAVGFLDVATSDEAPPGFAPCGVHAEPGEMTLVGEAGIDRDVANRLG